MLLAICGVFDRCVGFQLVMVIALTLVAFGSAACSGADQAQQDTSQEEEKASQSSPPASSAPGLVGTWEAIESAQSPGLGGGLLTFSEDGTFVAQPFPVDAPELVLSGEYSADGSRITFIDEEGGESQTEYVLEGDTLTTYTAVEDPEFPVDTTTIYQRKS
jgi:hypothetical protein